MTLGASGRRPPTCRPTLAGGALPEPGLHRLRLRRGRPGARPVLRRHRDRRRRHQVDHAGAALRAADPADGRDAERDAQLDRPAGPGHRRVPRARTWPGWPSAAPARSSRSPAAASRSTPAWPASCAATRASRWSRSTSPAPTSRTAARCSPATRAPRPRSSTRCGENTVRRRPGVRQALARRHRHRRRSPGPASTPAPTACR